MTRWLAPVECRHCMVRFKPKRAGQVACSRSCARAVDAKRRGVERRLEAITRDSLPPYLRGKFARPKSPGNQQVADVHNAQARSPMKVSKLQADFQAWLERTWEQPQGLTTPLPQRFETAMQGQAVGRWRARPVAGGKPLSDLERAALALEPVGLDREVRAGQAVRAAVTASLPMAAE